MRDRRIFVAFVITAFAAVITKLQDRNSDGIRMADVWRKDPKATLRVFRETRAATSATARNLSVQHKDEQPAL